MSFKYQCKKCTFENIVHTVFEIKYYYNRSWIWKCLKCEGEIKLEDISSVEIGK